MDENYRKENNNPRTDKIQLNVAKRNDPLHFISQKDKNPNERTWPLQPLIKQVLCMDHPQGGIATLSQAPSLNWR